MKKNFLITFVVLVAVTASAYIWWPSLTSDQTDENLGGRIMSIEDYVSQNISALSPEKEVLGGQFYVTAIEAEDGRGTVSYEDGHIAFTADFTYETNIERGHTITSFSIRD